MKRYAFKIDFEERTIIVDDYQDMIQYYFHEGKNPYEHEVYLMFDKYEFNDVDLLDSEEPGVVETTKNILGVEEYDIKDFDSFARYLSNI